jgi:hypothetical protein
MSAVAWVLGTFHTVALGLVLLLLVYPRGGLGATLGNLSTLTGLALFVALWATTVFTTGRAIAGLDLLGGTTSGFHRRALRWGGVSGTLFFLCLVGILVVNAILTAPPATNVGAIFLSAAFYGTFGLAFAFVIGALVGIVFATLDLWALRLARMGTPPRQAHLAPAPIADSAAERPGEAEQT